jgi:hypothetical protein
MPDTFVKDEYAIEEKLITRETRAVRTTQEDLRGGVMFTVPEAVAIYEALRQVGFPLVLQWKRYTE